MKRTGLLSRECPSGNEIYFIEQSSMLGSAATCEVSISGAAPNHCRVYLTREGYEVQDLTGLALVQINGRRAAKAPLRSGDKLRVASEILTFSEVWEEEPERPAPKRLSVSRSVVPSPAPAPRTPMVLLAAAGLVLGVVL